MLNQKDYINTSEKQGNSEELKDSNPFLFQSDNNTKIIANLLTVAHLKIYIRLRYTSYNNAGRAVDLSTTQVRQICNGFNIPHSAEKIKQIASGWGIDAVVLANLFAKCRDLK